MHAVALCQVGGCRRVVQCVVAWRREDCAVWGCGANAGHAHAGWCGLREPRGSFSCVELINRTASAVYQPCACRCDLRGRSLRAPRERATRLGPAAQAPAMSPCAMRHSLALALLVSRRHAFSSGCHSRTFSPPLLSSTPAYVAHVWGQGSLGVGVRGTRTRVGTSN